MTRVIVVLGSFAQTLKLLLELLQLFVRKVFKIDKFISRTFESADDLIQFQMDRFGIAVLGVLDQEHHEKGDDRCGSINNELPCIREMKGGTGQDPHEDDKHRSGKGPGAAKDDGTPARENAKGVTYDAKKIPFFSCSLNFSI